MRPRHTETDMDVNGVTQTHTAVVEHGDGDGLARYNDGQVEGAGRVESEAWYVAGSVSHCLGVIARQRGASAITNVREVVRPLYVSRVRDRIVDAVLVDANERWHATARFVGQLAGRVGQVVTVVDITTPHRCVRLFTDHLIGSRGITRCALS